MSSLRSGATTWVVIAAATLLVSGCALFDGVNGGGDDGPDGGLGDVCSRSNECASGFICAGGVCLHEGSVGYGAPCWATRDCISEHFCGATTDLSSNTGVCLPAGSQGVDGPCATAADCTAGLVCQVYGFSGSCQPGGASDLGESCTGTLDCLSGLTCAPDGTCKFPPDAYPPFRGVECEPDEGPFKVFFEVPRTGAPPADFFRTPFPSDMRVSEAGALEIDDFPRPGLSVLGVDLVDLYADALVDTFTGFSSIAVITFRFSQRLDFNTASGDTVKFVDVTVGDPAFGSGRGYSWGYTTARTLYNCQHRFTVRPSMHDPLRSKHTYAVYVTNQLRAEDGSGQAVQDADLVTVLSDSRPSDADLAHAWDAHAPFRTYLAEQNINAGTVAAVAVFTVQDTTGRAEALAAAVAAEPAPVLEDLTLCEQGVTSPCDDGEARTCGTVSGDFYEIHGRVRVPSYQQGTAPYETEGGAINAPAGTPEKVRDEMVCFALTIPKTGSGPWPVVVYGHGTGGSFKSPINNGVAAALATASTPTAVLSYDGVVHGERAAGSSRDADSLMFNVINPAAARDNNLQGAVDVMHLLRIGELGTVELPGVGETSLDTAKTYFFGHSQGSNVGIPALAVTGNTTGAVLSGAGSVLTTSLETKTSPVSAADGLKYLLNDPDFDGAHPVMTIFQTYFDSTDTVNYGRLLIKQPPTGVPSKNILQTYGLGDTYSPPETLKQTARAASLQQSPRKIDDLSLAEVGFPVSENVSGGDGVSRFGAVFQYEPEGFDGHFVATRDPQAVTDWVQFFTSLIDTGVATVTGP